jgi:hypothetical protein
MNTPDLAERIRKNKEEYAKEEHELRKTQEQLLARYERIDHHLFMWRESIINDEHILANQIMQEQIHNKNMEG